MEELIKKALKKLGLSEDLWEKISVTSETEIESAVKKLASEQREEKVRAGLKEKGLTEDFDKMLESKIDQAVTKAIQTHDAKKLETDKKKADEDAKTEEEKKTGGGRSQEKGG